MVVSDLEEQVADLEVEVGDVTMRKKHLYYFIHVVLTLYDASYTTNTNINILFKVASYRKAFMKTYCIAVQRKTTGIM